VFFGTTRDSYLQMEKEDSKSRKKRSRFEKYGVIVVIGGGMWNKDLQRSRSLFRSQRHHI